ncbi:hypothetical protein ACMG4P_07635 [Pseudovibrio denitrificans]|uniref:hypothetical protein n=1 Tax=Pseudovibrio denitrificans TaxID=258256 RepID=UPI0039BFAA66
MSKTNMKRTGLLCSLVGCAMIACVSNASANNIRGALVTGAICDDAIPNVIFKLGLLQATNRVEHVYYMEQSGEAFPITAGAPDLKDVDNLRVIAHGNCGSVGSMDSEHFAASLKKNYGDQIPVQIELLSCEAGSLKADSPVRAVASAFGNEAIVMGWQDEVGLTGNGHGSLRDHSFGIREDVLNEAWVKEMSKIFDGVEAQWDPRNGGKVNQLHCNANLTEALQDPNQNSFMDFIKETLSFYSSPEALYDDYNLGMALSFRLHKGRTVCGQIVKSVTGKDCIAPE